MLVADPRTIVSGATQSRYEHFAIEIGADGDPVELGRGAMGVTYRAVDTTLQRPVALKVISSRLIDNEVLRYRFIREARAAASLRHPNVASVFYLGATESTYFYAMELVTGETLEQFIEHQGPLKPDLALEITAQITSALVAAHQAGLVHRDIKPANLILTQDERGRMLVKVVDFGLVKLTAEPGDDSAMSDPGTFLGTPRYASPEQFSGGKIDIRSDLYAVGIVLWHMLTKVTPFNGTPTQVAAQHLQSPLPISELRHLPHPIVSLLTHLLEKNPDDRPQTPEELLVVLNATRRAIGGQAGAMVAVPLRGQRRWRWFSRSKGIYLIGALSEYTISELAYRFENIVFWIANSEDGEFTSPFHIAIASDPSQPGANLNEKYGNLSHPDIVKMLERFVFRHYEGLQRKSGVGTSYKVKHKDKDGARDGLSTDGLKKVADLLQRFVFVIENKTAQKSFAHRLKGKPAEGYEQHPSLLDPHHKFSLREVLDNLRHLRWNVVGENQEFHNPDFTMLIKKIHVE